MNSGRLSGRVEPANAPLQLSTPASTSSAKEGLRSQAAVPTRVTDAAVQRLRHTLTALDYRVIDTLKTVRVATGGQLRSLHWPDTETGKRMARHHLAKLTRLRVLARLDRRVGGVRAGSDGHTYVLDVAGQHLVADSTDRRRRRRPTTPGDRYTDHALAVTERCVDLHTLEAAGVVELLAFEAEPDSWRRFPGPDGRTLTIKPDAFVLLADAEWEHRWFLEIDRATEHRPTIVRKARDYLTFWQSGTEQATSSIFPRVLWIAPTEQRAATLRDWLTAPSPVDVALFEVCTDLDFQSHVRGAVEDGR